MPTTLAQLAELVKGRLTGEGNLPITGAATLEVVESEQITLTDNADRATELANSPAAAAIVNESVGHCEIPTIVVDDVHAAFAQVVMHFRPQRSQHTLGISPQAFIDPSARIADDAEVHPGATIGADVVIGSGSIVHTGARLLAGCQIGSDVMIFPNAVLYEDTLVGDRAIIHGGAVLGAYGFGYKENNGRHELSAQLGNVEIGADVEIGACTTIDRGTYGPTIIGEGTKVDDLVQIAHNCRVGKHNLICGQVGIAGSTTTGDYVVMAGQVGVRDHVHIGDRAVLCSKAGVPNNVPDGEVVLGQPATPIRQQKLQMAAIAKLPEMRKQFKAMQREIAKLQAQLGEDDQTQDQAA